MSSETDQFLVLYSCEDNNWKITDFGLTTEGTSRRALTTKYSRGTASYRAPELFSAAPKFTNKIDIWALGCVFHEVIYLEKAFAEDYNVRKYSEAQKDFSLPGKSPIICDDAMFAVVKDAIQQMLKRDPSKRPTALWVENKLKVPAKGHSDSTVSLISLLPFSIYSILRRLSRFLPRFLVRFLELATLVVLLAICFLVLAAVACITFLFWVSVFAIGMEFFFPRVCEIVFEETASGDASSQWLSHQSCSIIQKINSVVLDLWERVTDSGIWN